MPEIQNERLAKLEANVEHIVGLLEDYCTLKDDVIVVKTDITWMKRIGYSFVSVFGLSLLGVGVKRFFFDS